MAVEILQKKNVQFETKDYNERSSMVMSCFTILCLHFNLTGVNMKKLYKPVHPDKVENSEQEGLETLLKGLKTETSAYILLTSDKILCPVGFEYTPLVPIDAYKKLDDIKPENLELWIMTASVQRTAAPFVIKRWKHINQSLQTLWPNYLNLD